MSQEIELKLRLSPRTAAALARHPLLRNQPVSEHRLFNTYYDTPDLRLRERAVALRFRRSGDDCLLTIKGGQPSIGGLAARAEWETPAHPGEFDFAHVGDDDLRRLLESCREKLTPVFRTDFTRQAWLLQYRDTDIELALDRGQISAGKRRVPICELEMELLDSTDPTPLFTLALEVAANVPMHPEPTSKAERGYALFLGRPEPPAPAAKTPVSREMSAVAAFRAIALGCLGQLQQNEAGVLAGQDPEFVHQSRVAIRRLRSALGLFAPALPTDFVVTYGPPWREVARVLGTTRDWDVLVGETLCRVPPGVLAPIRRRELLASAETARSAAFRTTCNALRRPSYGRFLLMFMADVLALPHEARGQGDDLRRYAIARLHQRWEKTSRQLKHHSLDDPAGGHILRLQLKKLRYAMEFLTPVLPKKRTLRLHSKVAGLQDLLGQLNDLDAARRLLATHPVPLHALDTWLATEYTALLAHTKLMFTLFRRKNPW